MVPVSVKKRLATVEEYFEFAENALEKQEFHEGEILAMSGNSYEHSLVAANAMREIGNRLKGSRCRVLDSNMRVSVIPGDAKQLYVPGEFATHDRKDQKAS